jgi:two-component system, OmpR family, sensor histidine kinase BaeS
MMALRLRLTLSYLAVVALGMTVAAALAWDSVERLYLEMQRANLLAEAQRVASRLGAEPASDVAAPYSQLANTQLGIHTHVLASEGAIVLDLQPPGPRLLQGVGGQLTPEELLGRPEIAQALAGQPATAIREIAGAGGRRVLYAAAPVPPAAGASPRVIYIASPLPDTGWDALPASLLGQLLGAAALALAAAGVAGWWLALRISEPLASLAQGADRVAAGDLNYSVPVDSSVAELAGLGRAFNAMTASLRQGDLAKTAFIADVTHELRTPLTVIKGTVETLQDGAVDDLDAREGFLASITHETERLIRMVNHLLVLTRADAGVLQLQPRLLDLGALARARACQLAALAAQRGVQLSVNAPNSAPVLADELRLAQVIDNLLDNAIRHTPRGGKVAVTVMKGESKVSCAVADTGAGIAAEHLPLIFERFYRADASRSRSLGGCGLGLAISRALVTAHGGQIGAASTVGQGTTVSFCLPASASCHKTTPITPLS